MIRRSIVTLMLFAMAMCIALSGGSALAADVTVDSDITASEYWTNDNTYYLDGIIFVTNEATLTIEPGTVIRGMPDSETTGNNNPGTLVVARGAKIFADGTPDNPIVFTDMNDDNVPGGAKVNPLYNNNPSNMITENWGGVILLGDTYIANDTEAGPVDTREEQIEGITDEAGKFGGGDDDDSSGSMSYVSIRYGGYGLLENEEINGLTMGGVGRGTTLHHIEVANNVDDGYEWFGGTVNSKYLISWNIGDDSMDTDRGYRGKSQFGLVVKGTCKSGQSASGGGVANRAFEMDGGKSPDGSRPYALSQWRNYTLIGMGSGTTDAASDDDTGIVIRDNARPQIYHTIVMDMGKDGVDIEDLEGTEVDSVGGWTAAFDAYPDDASFYTTQTQGFQTEIADCLFYNIGGTKIMNVDDSAKGNVELTESPIQGVQRVAAPGYSDIMLVSALDPRPTGVAMDPVKELSTDGFFTPVDYYGAFGPNNNWAEGWSLISSMGVLAIGGAQPVTAGFDEDAYKNANPDLPASWTDAEARNHYRMFGFAEGRDVYWSTADYLALNTDLAGMTDEQALAHWITFGKDEGRVAWFQADEYRTANPDLAGMTDEEALSHWTNYGRAEGRLKGFDYLGYLEMNEDMPGTWGYAEALNHYMQYGMDEGRAFDPYVE